MDNQAENNFKGWLDRHKIPYWYVDQSLESFSPALKELLMKRVDFMILLPNFGWIFVDVKEKSPGKKYPKFFLEAEEVEKYLGMQSVFNMQIWFVISNEDYHYKTWFWVPVSKVTKSGLFFKPREGSGDPCYSVPIEEFIQISENDNLDRLFGKLFRTVN